jgi:flavin reductase (DIM6/NTAB) family NADH-FMN oxidoreductase RutF
MVKINLGSQVVSYPMPVAIVGTMVTEKPNFMTVAWFSMVSHTPPKIAVVLGNHHFTNIGIKSSGVFSICLPSIEQIVKVDYAGLVSGKNDDKSALFTLFYGVLKTAPMIEECPVCVECKLDKIVVNGANETFIGDICGLYSEEKYMTDGKIDFEKVRPMVLSQGNQTYWSLGTTIGHAWKIGKKMLV